ncbi:MAG TPA: hypothetical protein VGE98_01705 [Thermoanaerobaculia bacterium]
MAVDEDEAGAVEDRVAAPAGRVDAELEPLLRQVVERVVGPVRKSQRSLALNVSA